MKLETFKYRMKHERCGWDITKDISIWVEKRRVELWNSKTDETQTFKTIDEALDTHIEGKKLRTWIDELVDFPPLILDSAM